MTRALVTGARGFVGSRLVPLLEQKGVQVRAGLRRPPPGSPPGAGRELVRCDLDDPSSVRAALEGCQAAYYLVHAMASGHGYAERERVQAQAFASAAAAAGLSRIVYLGGPLPPGPPSAHLRSRLAVGEALRAGAVPVLELRASMIVGHGSISWKIVRDLSTRLPVMLLPRWTRSRTQPIAIEDVLTALAGGLSVALPAHRVANLPGPETLTLRQILERVARVRGRRPAMVPVPFLSPRLSGLWLRFVSGAPSSVAEELVMGLGEDLVMPDDGFWAEVAERPLTPFDEAVRRAFEEESRESARGLAARAVERLAGALSSRA